MTTKLNSLGCYIICIILCAFSYTKLQAQFLYTGPQIGVSNMQPIMGWSLGYHSGRKIDMVFEANTPISHLTSLSNSSTCLSVHYHPMGTIKCMRGLFLLPYISIGAGGIISKSVNTFDVDKTPIPFAWTYRSGAGVKLRVWCFYLLYPEVGVMKTQDALPFYFTLNAAKLLGSSCQKARFSRDQTTMSLKKIYGHRSHKSIKCAKSF